MGLFNSIKRLFSPEQPTNTGSSPSSTREQARQRLMAASYASRNWYRPTGTYTGEKYGTLDYYLVSTYDYDKLRRNSRGIYHDSTIAKGAVRRLKDTVINTGLTWESAPIWDLIPNGPPSEGERYEWTKYVESLWKIYAESQEPDIENKLTFGELQRKAYGLRRIDGELFGIIRYLNASKRTSPVTVQLIRPEQVINPTDYRETRKVEAAGGYIDHGIEYNKTGQVVAIHVRGNWDMKTVRIPIFGPKSGRRFVIHTGNFEMVGQPRALPELATVVYELKKLTDYDVAELEATVATAAWIGEESANVNAEPGKSSGIKPNVSNATEKPDEPQQGIEKVDMGHFALYKHRNYPGYETKWYQPNRPNANYEKFVDAMLTHIAGSLGMPLSVLKQQFNASYSAARAEILFYWNTVKAERAAFATGFLNPIHEAWFTEHVRNGNIFANGFDSSTTIRRAWLHGTWNGISRPSVDPVKEVKAVEFREKLGHTTKEREAKAYNGSDFRENAERLSEENRLMSAATPAEPEAPPND